MKKGKVLKRLGAVLLSAALALVPLSSALAENNLPYDPTGETTGSITVHKYFRDSASATAGDSQEIEDADELAALGTPADADERQVGFTLYKVNSNFTMAIDTPVATALANALPVGSEELTNADGEISWSDLAIGYYVLVETTPLTGYDPSPSAIIALPYALDDNEWNYDIHVYPKNVNQIPLIKDIVNEQTAYGVGEEVTWKYSAQVDYASLYTAADGETPAAYGSYRIIDALDERLDYDFTDSASTVSVTGTGGTPVSLTSDDYTITEDAVNHAVIWTLTNAGLEKLAANKITSLEIQFKTTINDKALATGAGVDEIPNGGTLEWTNSADEEQDPYEIEEEDKPAAKLYSLVIKKTNNDESLLLDGAEFKIALSSADAKAGIFIQDADDDDLVVTTGPNGTLITGGWAMFTGLTGSTTLDTDYYLVETVAPTNADGEEYVRPTEPIKVTIAANTQINNVTIKNYLIDDPDIPPMWQLPLTGGMGTVIFYVVGAIVMIGAVLLFVRSKRNKAAH